MGGLELDDALLAEARTAATEQAVGHLCEFRAEDIMERKWAGPGRWGAVFVFLLPEAMQELEQSLLELDCPVLCGGFALPTTTVATFGEGWSLYRADATRSGEEHA